MSKVDQGLTSVPKGILMREGANSICRILGEAGFEALLAGGCVRDTLLKVHPKDYDIATSATPDQVAQLFPNCISVGAVFGVQTVVLNDVQYEVATFRSDGKYSDGRRPDSVEFCDAQHDAERRDFTVNALFMNPETNEIIDYVNGQSDLSNRCIRAVGDPETRFGEDHLRLLRAVRFSSQLDFEIEADTYAALCTQASLLKGISAERIRNELERILTQPRASQAFQILLDTGLLAAFLPELIATVDCQQPPEYHPEGDVFTHTLLLLDHLESPTFTLAMAALLHDIGKPVTQTFEDRIRFNQHEKVGASMTDSICNRLHLSNDHTDRITWLVAQHMRIGVAPDMRESKRKRLVREEGFDELLKLMRVDCLASHGDLSTYAWLKDYSENMPPEDVHPEPLLTGNDLIELGYVPGPLFKEILTALEDAQLEGEIDQRDAALDFVQKRWPITTPN